MFDFSKTSIPITKDKLFSYVSPEQIFFHYFGPFTPISKVYPSPLRHDPTPSFGFCYNKRGEVIAKDLGKDIIYDAVTFVSALHNISYTKAMQKILFDFNISNDEVICKPTLIERSSVKFDDRLKKKTKIQIKTRAFNREELHYWNKQFRWNISEEELTFHDVFAFDRAFINSQPIFHDKSLKFAFYQRDLLDPKKGYFKIYQPNSRKHKWLSNIPLILPFGIDKLPRKSDTLIISKGKKDLMILKKFFTDVVATQNESLSAIINCVDISKNYKRTIVIYDADAPGVEACTKITNQYNWEYWNTPNYLLRERGITDIPEYVTAFGLRTLEKRFKEQGLL